MVLAREAAGVVRPDGGGRLEENPPVAVVVEADSAQGERGVFVAE